jgi:hypothetical protein
LEPLLPKLLPIAALSLFCCLKLRCLCTGLPVSRQTAGNKNCRGAAEALELC